MKTIRTDTEGSPGQTPRAGSGRDSDRATLAAIAHRAMRERNLEPDFSPEALQELAALPRTPPGTESLQDLRAPLWSSLDNDSSRDLDQLTVAEPTDDGRTRIRVAIADVDALVSKGSAIDRHAQRNTTSVYTPAAIFPMLPEALSTDRTSLNEDQDRSAVVVDILLEADGALAASAIYRAQVRNHAKLAYNAVAGWLDGDDAPARVTQTPGLAESLRLQDWIAQQLGALRHRRGALGLETTEANAVFAGDSLADLALERKNRAKQLIEDFMIAANGVTAAYLSAKGFPSLRRVLRAPERWDRIVQLAHGYGERLPDQPDAAALDAFLARRRRADPERFADVSLAIVKLMGRGEYALDLPGDSPAGHFGLAVRDYTHATAPNRRFPDLITQRLLKAALAGAPPPYSVGELAALARHCTLREDDAAKVERRVRKSAAALLLAGKVGMRFDALVTGASSKGTWVRLIPSPIEGRLERGFQGLDVGDRVQVMLVRTDVERGFIDFVRD